MRSTSLAAALAASACMFAIAAPAQAQQRSFDIPSGSLKAALDTFGRQSGRPVIYRAEDVNGINSPDFAARIQPSALWPHCFAAPG
ncbi:hypothetical protein PIB19_01135 [Sphingomonas sp. 7/4-4]|uniref:hypothetical protein n=1 Tax=Sphingomonas sp. 7/4-4 TaxID=3018446 RepID=UPI0022F3C269|nr:hypothetical protein [Sphingomonas sp. 7/4-4]WBY08192.1 hypothetical protein PIB19_01135 [Sphingomonas sp. 7/4-4]